MKITIVSGSHRKGSQSGRIAKVCEEYIKKIDSKIQTYIVDLEHTKLPLWDEEVWAGAEKWKKIWGPISTELQSSDAFVIISPEWSGMVPAGLKNFFSLCSPKDLGHKPAVIVGVSSTRGGAYPVAELRMSSYKNTFLNYIPDHVIVRDCEKMFVSAEPSSPDETYLREKLTYSLRMLGEYAKALKIVRESGVVDFKKFPFGM